MAKRNNTGQRGRYDPLVIGLQVAHAHHLSRLLAAGLKPAIGELQQLDTMPPGVRDAVLACYRANSRYLPKFVKKQRQAGPMPLGPKATLKSRRYDYWRDKNPQLAAAIRHNDDSAAEEARRFRIVLPANVSGFGQVISAFAEYCRVSPVMIRLYMKSAQKLDRDTSALLDPEWRKKAQALFQHLKTNPELVLTREQEALLGSLEDFLLPEKDKKRRS